MNKLIDELQKQAVNAAKDAISEKIGGGETKNLAGAVAGKAVNQIAGGAFEALKMKIIVGVSAAVALLIAGLVLYFDPFGWNISFGSLFGGSEVKIERTVNVVDKVKKISELVTSCYYEEYVVQDSKQELKETGFFTKSIDTLHNEIVITVKGSVRAGFDLSKMADDAIKVQGDTIDIKLPVPQILDIISNPSDYTIFEESGKWSHEEIVALLSQGKERVLNNALQHNLLFKANESGKERVADLFRSFGFSVVNVTTTPIAQ